jgi:hypothetical protein
MITPKELRPLLKLCREFGVTEANLGTVTLKFGDLPERPSDESTAYQQTSDDGPSDPFTNFPNEVMSPERLQYYAMGGTPEGDPFKDE